jgi:hypothetical protein
VQRRLAAAAAAREAESTATTTANPLTVAPSIFHRQHTAACANHWQILQLAPTNQPGIYKVNHQNQNSL